MAAKVGEGVEEEVCEGLEADGELKPPQKGCFWPFSRIFQILAKFGKF